MPNKQLKILTLKIRDALILLFTVLKGAAEKRCLYLMHLNDQNVLI